MDEYENAFITAAAHLQLIEKCHNSSTRSDALLLGSLKTTG